MGAVAALWAAGTTALADVAMLWAAGQQCGRPGPPRKAARLAAGRVKNTGVDLDSCWCSQDRNRGGRNLGMFRRNCVKGSGVRVRGCRGHSC
jgi:hypothetical protein